MTACCQAVLSCQKLSWPFCAGQPSLLTLKSLHLLSSKGTWRVQDIDTLRMCNLEKQGRCTDSVLHPWLLQRSECALLSIFRRTQTLPLLSLAVPLESEVTGEQPWSYVQRSFLQVCCSAFSFQFSSFGGVWVQEGQYTGSVAAFVVQMVFRLFKIMGPSMLKRATVQ